MPVVLRQYQEHALELLDGAYARGATAPLLCMPTGSGKTKTIAEYIRRNSGKKFLFVVHTRELLAQTAKAFRETGIDDFVVISQTPKTEINSRVVICGIDRLRLGEGLLNNPDIVICDEAHLYPSPQRFNTLLRFKHAKLLGLSATPSRGDMNTLDKIFDSIFHPVLISELIALGSLVPVELVGAAERTRVDWNHADEDDWAPYKAYREFCKGKRTLIFTNKTQQSKIFLEFLAREGVSAAEVNGAMNKIQRDKILKDFAEGKYEAIVNVRVLTAGYDLPELQAIMLLSPSLERSTYMQVLGRVMRTSPGKTKGIVCDMTGAHTEHGCANSDSWYALFDGEKDFPCLNCGAELEAKDWIIKKDISCQACQETKSYGRHCGECGYHYVKPKEEPKPKRELTRKEKEAYPQHLAQRIQDLISTKAPVLYANHKGIQGRLKDAQERSKVLEWQAANFVRDDTETRQSMYYALHSHLKFLERIKKRTYHPMWAESVYKSHYGVWANGNWKKMLPKDE